ncbi:MAG TPA: TatD family hydrolase [Candidatus Dojkabacteria bacterium]|nr:TatD family hydrolase [Candidatus Dojkabacteria bacterium]
MHDSHIHLNLCPLQENIEQIINDFQKENGKHILTQSTDLLDYRENLDISKRYSDIVQLALGLHPTVFEEYTVQRNIFKDIQKKSLKMIADFEDIFEKNILAISAVGETGLDYYQFNNDQTVDEDIKEELCEIQEMSFTKHIQLALKHNLPMSIHARDMNGSTECLEDVLRIVAQEGRGQLKGSFHSYTGNLDLLADILDMGFYIGFNGIITYKSGENVRDILKEVPLERILFETDGPFLPPQSVRKDKKLKEKYAQPKDIKEIIQMACEVKNTTYEKMERVTDENYERLFVL